MNGLNIKEKIKNYLKNYCIKNNIPENEIRLKITRKKGFITSTIKFYLLRNTELLSEIDLKEVLGLNPLQISMVNTFLSNYFSIVSKKYSIDEDKINAIFYGDENNIRIYLFEGDVPKKEISIEELLN